MNQNTNIVPRLLAFYRDDPEARKVIEHAHDNDEPIRFSVLWKEDIIGTLYIKENQHKYVPNKEVIQKLKKKVFIFAELTKPQDWGRPIFCLQEMIDNCVRFPGRGWIGYHNNNYSLELLKDKK